jgi:hypothetical protein
MSNKSKVRNVLEPVSLDDCRHLFSETGSTSASSLFSANSPDFPDAVRREILLSRCSPEEIAKLSALFVEDRTQALGKIQPVLPDSLKTSLLFVPTSKVSAFAVAGKNGYVALTTAGLYDLLRAHCVNSVWSACLDRIEKKLGTSLASARAVEEYLHLRSILFLAGRGTIPLIEDAVSVEVRNVGWRLAEASLLFIVLHEYGHAHYARMDGGDKDAFANSICLRVKEELTATKVEEFFADRFALDCFSPELVGPMLHASTVFFSLRGAIEAAGFAQGQSHPLALNRLWALSECARDKIDSQKYKKYAVGSQLMNMERMWSAMTSFRGDGSESLLKRLTELAQKRETEVDLPVVISGVSALEKYLVS